VEGATQAPIIDSHAHLDDPRFDADREEVIRRAREAGIEAIVTIGCNLTTSRSAVGMADRYDFVYATVGIHPHEVNDATDAAYEELVRLAKHPKVVGWGETGLDYYYRHSPKEVQIAQFQNQIRLAKRLNLPLMIHSRDAEEDTLTVFKEEGADAIGGVLHCFTGSLGMAQAAIGMGFYISFSGILTFANAKPLRATARSLPMDRLMIETDSPYLSPVPHRGKRNEPAHVREVAKALASLHPQSSYEEVRRRTAENAKRLFGIP
jgi:TatD DNase family protein